MLGKTVMVVVLLASGLAAVALGQWEPDLRLTTRVNTNDTKQTSSNNAWCVAVAPPHVHVVWYDYRDASWRIYYRRSTDNGTTWGEDRCISDSASSTSPSVAVSGPYVHVAWQQRISTRIYYTRSTDYGLTWTESDRELTASTNLLTGTPSVAASGAYVYVVWYYRTPYPNRHGVHYRRSTDNGASWGPEVLLGTEDGSQYDRGPSIAAKGAYVHLVRNQVVSTAQAYYSRSTDDGATWSSEVNISNADPAAATNFSIATDSGSDVHVVWQAWLAPVQIFHTRSTDNGATWPGYGTQLTTGNAAYCPSVAAAGDTVHIAWYDGRVSQDNYEIYYKRSADCGSTWSDDIRLTNAAGNSWCSSAAAAGNAVHVVWEDARDDSVYNQFEVYYKRNLTGQSAVGEPGSSFTVPRSSLSAVPNPVTAGFATLRISGPAAKRSSGRVRVFDAAGRCVLVRPLVIGDWSLGTPLDMRSLPSGVYLVRLDATGTTATRKLVVQREDGRN